MLMLFLQQVFGRKSFRHGVHPDENKDSTSEHPVRRFPFAPQLIIPVRQGPGKPARLMVAKGQEVQRGQLLAEADGWMSVPVHAPASGTVVDTGLYLANSGRKEEHIVLAPFAGDSQLVPKSPGCSLDSTPEEIIAAVQQAGFVGMGGASFPTHVKLKVPEGMHVDTLLINGVECEPYLTTDHRVMLEQREEIYTGIRYLLRATGARRAVIGIEANKADAIEGIRSTIPDDLPLTVEALKVKYPQGAEKILIASVLGREVPSGGLPASVHVVCCNVATAGEIGRLLPAGQGLVERVITVGGPAVLNPGNYLVPVGTPLRYLLDQLELREGVRRVVYGGPMMGQAVADLDVPVTKACSGILVFTDQEQAPATEKTYPCIKCGHCLDACPVFLNPARLGFLARSHEYETMEQDYHLRDCFECGACSWICPSNIPLVQSFRVAKQVLKERKAAP